jgi:tRNA A-37 threonylcarbamoyl transferase component Bud32
MQDRQYSPIKFEFTNNALVWPEETDFSEFDKNTQDLIKSVVSNPDKYIGHGGAAMVFGLEEPLLRINGLCIKLTKNRHTQSVRSFNLGNSIKEEFNIQYLLKDLNIDGVRCPKVIAYLESQNHAAIIMERLEAVNMQLVINGKEDLPANFDLEIFFGLLEEYIHEMHELGISHNDLEMRNVMIDKTTGKPRIIDFGRSVILAKVDKIKTEKLKTGDFDNIYSGYQKTMTFLTKKEKYL